MPHALIVVFKVFFWNFFGAPFFAEAAVAKPFWFSAQNLQTFRGRRVFRDSAGFLCTLAFCFIHLICTDVIF